MYGPSPSPARALACILAVACALLARPAGAPAQEGHPYRVRPSAAPCLILRASPESTAPRQDCLAVGIEVEVVGSAPYWRRIRTVAGRTGWVAKKFLEPLRGEPSPPARPAAPSDDAWLEIHVVDVGQGDGIWIHTADDGIDGNGVLEGRNIVVDGGPNASDRTNQMLAYLRRFAHHGATIDALVVTHPHDDHYPGAEGVLRHFEVRSYYDPGYPKTGEAYAAFREAVRRERVEGLPVREVYGRASIGPLDWGRELTAEILYAYPGTPEGLGSGSTRENNASIVLRIEYGAHSFLLMGDAEGKHRRARPEEARYVEKILLETVPREKLASTVLKLAHHGSETSSTRPFMEVVNPGAIVVSSGRRSFGGRYLPDETVLDRYCEQNPDIEIYRTDRDDAAEGRTGATDQDGDHVVIRTNGRELRIQQYSSGRAVDPETCMAR